MRLLMATHESAVLLGGVLTLALGGVRLYIDRTIEEFYVEVEPGFDLAALKQMQQVISTLGFEPLPEWECPPEEFEDGVVRHWLAEKEGLYDATLKAV